MAPILVKTCSKSNYSPGQAGFLWNQSGIMRAARILGAESGLTWGEIESSMGTAVLVCPGLAPQGVFSPHTFV